MPLLIGGPWRNLLQVVTVRVTTSMGSISILAEYASPNVQVGSDTWSALIDSAAGGDALLLCGDFNAHSPLWGSRFSNLQGCELCSVILNVGLVSLNDSQPTFLPAPGRSAGNLDLVFFTASRIGTASVSVTGDTYGSDHFLLLGDVDVSPLLARSNSNRLNTKNVDWCRFRELVDDMLPISSEVTDGFRDPALVYDQFPSSEAWLHKVPAYFFDFQLMLMSMFGHEEAVCKMAAMFAHSRSQAG